MKKTETHYTAQLNASGYEFFDVVVNEESGQIKIKFFEERWRTPKETMDVLQEMSAIIRKDFLD